MAWDVRAWGGCTYWVLGTMRTYIVGVLGSDGLMKGASGLLESLVLTGPEP